MKMKSTKRALLMSALSLLLCCSMLIGTTFAWFTDTVESGINKITAGNLDVELYYGKELTPATNKVVNTTADLFTDENGKAILWEPGAVAYTNLNVVNAGTLALKYQFAINFDNENYIKENGAKLSQVLKVAFLNDPIPANSSREDVLKLAKDAQGVNLTNLMKAGTLEAEKNKVYGVVIYWEPSAIDNDWNVFNGRTTSDNQPLHIDLGIKLVATQLEAESDSFGSDYDKDAWADGMIVMGEADLLAALANGEDKIVLGADIVSENGVTVDKDAAINLNGHVMTATGERAYLINVIGDADLTVVNGTLVAQSTNGQVDGTGASTGSSSSIYFKSTGTLTVENVQIQGSVRGGHRAIDIYGGNAVLNNVDITSSYGAGVVAGGAGVTAVLNDCDITVNGMYSAPYNSVCFGVWGGADLTVNSGNYKLINDNTYSTGDTHGGWVGIVMSSGGTITTNGGTFTNVPAAGFNPQYERAILEAENNAPAVSTLNLLGGTFIPQEDMVYAGYGNQYYPTYNVPNLIDCGNGVWVAAPAGVDKVVINAADLLALSAKYFTGNNGVAESYTIMLGANIDMNGADFSAIIAQRGDTLNFIGNGYTISNVNIISGAEDNTTGQASMFYAFPNSTLNVSDLILKDITVTADKNASGYAAAVIGYCEGAAILNNVDVVNATVVGVKSSGVLAGHVGNGGTMTANNCDISGTVTLADYESGGHYAGKYLGTMAGDITLNNCTADVTVSGNLNANNIGDIYGRKVSGNLTIDGKALTSNAADVVNGGNFLLTGDIQNNSAIKNDTSIDLNGNTFEATSSYNLNNNADLTMTDGDYVVNGTYGHVDVRPNSAEGSTLLFENIDFSFNKLEKSYGPSTNRLGSVVEICPEVAGAHVVAVFKNCTFNNAKVLFEGMSGKVGTFEATFENCTFNALTSSAPIEVQNYIEGTITVKNCTFNLECTSSVASAITISPSSSTKVTVVAENNTFNAVAATPSGEAGTVEQIKVNGTPANIKFISAYDNATVTETGTVKSGIAK